MSNATKQVTQALKSSKPAETAPTAQVLPTIASVAAAKAAKAAETVVVAPTAQPTKKSKKRDPIIRVTHPALKPDAAGTPTVALTAYPDDWSSIYHKALTPSNFTDEVTYMLAKADWHDKQAVALRAEAEEVKRTGGSSVSKDVKKMKKVLASLPELLASTAGKGVDLSALLSSLQALQAAQTAKTVETTPAS